MEWLAQNWIWLVVFVLFIGMHLFGHGGRGGHGSHGGCGGSENEQPPSGEKRSQGHQH